MRVPTPAFEPGDRQAAQAWVGDHLGRVVRGPVRASPEFVGGQVAADAALNAFDVTGYAARRNEVWPEARQGASRLSPYIRHGLLSLPQVWRHVAGGPARDVGKFRDELLWQEYARHLYARMGSATAAPLRFEPPVATGHARTEAAEEPEAQMACWQWMVGQLEHNGWLPNQARMWFASHWTVRRGWSWAEGENHFFGHLLDGSRAANRLGWQWTVGAGTGKPYGFSRWQVNKRAPGMCNSCSLRERCPIEEWPDPVDPQPVPVDPRLRAVGSPAAETFASAPTYTSAGPIDDVEEVWITAESLGEEDPAMASHPEAPAVFVFDAALLQRLELAGQRLVFLAECLADLAGQRELAVYVGNPVEVLVGRKLAATHAPVPGWRRIADRVEPVAVHPWPWLVPPGTGPLNSFSAWRKRARPRP